MKSQNLKIALLVILTALVTAFITNYIDKGKNHTSDIPDKDRSATSICMDYDTDPPPVLTTELVKSMVMQYKGVQLNNIQTATTNPIPVDAQSIWFDLETLKKFLYHIEHNVGKNYEEGRDKKIGVRIYYAAYPKNEEMKRMAETQKEENFTFNPNYEGLHTLVMIPTISGQDGENYDFNPLDKKTYNGFTKMEQSDKFSFINSNYSTLTLGPNLEPEVTTTTPNPNPVISRNHGSLAPPDSVVGFGF
jgi:hypothetical protein